MTTAHRPTWKAAVGRADEGGFAAPSSAKSILDGPAHTKLKLRKGHQLIHDDDANNAATFRTSGISSRKAQLLRKSLEKLQQAEAKLKLSKGGGDLRAEHREIIPAIEAEGELRLLKQTADVDDVKVKEKYKDQDADHEEGGKGNDDDWSDDLDSDGDDDDDESDLDDSEDDESDDDEDEEAALQAELAKIRAERAAAKAKQEAEAAKEEEARLEEAALLGNPLLSSASNGGGAGLTTAASGKLKRRWNDDVVFRNQAKGEPDRNKKRFINDTVRNDFHKRFLNKFIL